MEKICIVKLRKHLTRPSEVIRDQRQEGSGRENPHETKNLSCNRERKDGWSGIDRGDDVSGKGKDRASRSVTLALTEEQTRSLRSNRFIQEIARDAHGFEGTGPGSAPVVLQLQFAAIPPLRMLRPQEVTHMLGISRSLLNRLVKRGELPGYKIGRVRRYKLDDILSYLEKSFEVNDGKS